MQIHTPHTPKTQTSEGLQSKLFNQTVQHDILSLSWIVILRGKPPSGPLMRHQPPKLYVICTEKERIHHSQNVLESLPYPPTLLYIDIFPKPGANEGISLIFSLSTSFCTPSLLSYSMKLKPQQSQLQPHPPEIVVNVCEMYIRKKYLFNVIGPKKPTSGSF